MSQADEQVGAAVPASGHALPDSWDNLHETSAPSLHWTTSNLGEAMPGVLTPLSWSVWGPVVEHAPREAARAIGGLTTTESKVPERVEDRCIRIFYGRPAMQVEFLATLGDRMPGTTGPDTVASMFGRVPDDIEFRPTKRRYLAVAALLPHAFLSAPRKAKALADDTQQWWSATHPTIPLLDRVDALTLFDEARRRLDHAVTLQSILILSTMQPLYDALRKFVAKTGVGTVEALSGSGGAEMAVVSDIWAASRGRLSLSDVLDRHGFHGPLEGELSSTVWREDDSPVRGLVEGYANRCEDEDPVLRQRRRQQELSTLQRRVVAAVPRVQRPAVRALLRLAAERLPLRGVPKRAFLQAFDITRATARRIGALFYADGLLDDPEDVFYLTADELTGDPPEHARELVALRRKRRTEYQAIGMPPEWTGMPEAIPLENPAATSEPPGREVTGIGVSSGTVEGVARIVHDPDFADVQPDEVLVTTTTDPSWSSIMFISSAIVVDIGGALSHAAVVARELGVPCVVNTRVGTSVIKTGDRLRVDGKDGTVTILESASSTGDGRDRA